MFIFLPISTIMDRLAGRPFLFLAMVIASWAGARMLHTDATSELASARKKPANMPTIAPPAWPLDLPEQNEERVTLNQRAPAGQTAVAFLSAKSNSVSSTALPWAVGGQPSGHSLSRRVAVIESPTNMQGTTPRLQVLERKAGNSISPQSAFSDINTRSEKGTNRLSLYAYSFWRSTDAPTRNSLAPLPQYGGSQTGLNALWDPFGAADSGPAVLLRHSYAPSSNQHEWAIGTRWRPSRHLPVSFSVERRFRTREQDVFAAIVSGGVDDVGLVGPVTVDAFGQSGFVTGRNTTGFFDVQSRAKLKLAHVADIRISSGVGAWAGGQKGGSRLDIGPMVEAHIPISTGSVKLQAEWRFRIAGRTVPASGPAITLSGGF